MPVGHPESRWRLTELIAGLQITHVSGPTNPAIMQVADDSRVVQSGGLFIARQGANLDGGRFVDDAIDRGAVAILARRAFDVPSHVAMLTAGNVTSMTGRLAERFHGDPASQLKLIGITGTNGKTTVAHLVRHIIVHAGHRCGLIGTVNVHDGCREQAASLTTPGAIELSATLARMAANGCDCCVMEVSSHALQQRRTSALDFDVAVFTNLSGDHLDYHRTMEEYAKAKALLFDHLAHHATAIVNVDDPAHQRMIRDTHASVVRTSIMTDADISACIHASSRAGNDLTLSLWRDSLDLRLPLIGAHNVGNAVQAAACAFTLGLTSAQIVSALEVASAPPGRYEPVVGPGENGPLVLVDYAHTDHALENALTGLRHLVPTGGKLRVVFGCGGDRDRGKRPRMARVACDAADVVYVTSDNPRTEDPAAIVDEILAGVPRSSRAGVHAIVDREDAITRAISDCAAHDILLIAGKGHEDYQVVGHVKNHFDDRVVAAEALRARELQPK